MELYIGGFAQGKLDYVLSQKNKAQVAVDVKEMVWEECQNHDSATQIQKYKVVDGETTDVIYAMDDERIILNHFHRWFRRLLQEGKDAEQQVEALLETYSDIVIISDEIGNGIVPMDAFERVYRERLGRVLILVAKRAERVERILCGLGQRLK